LKPNLSAPKAPLCTPVSCTKTLPRTHDVMARIPPMRRSRSDRTIALPARVGRPNTVERSFCQADPARFGLLRGEAAVLSRSCAIASHNLRILSRCALADQGKRPPKGRTRVFAAGMMASTYFSLQVSQCRCEKPNVESRLASSLTAPDD